MISSPSAAADSKNLAQGVNGPPHEAFRLMRQEGPFTWTEMSIYENPVAL